jgi:hypothetical protein
MKRAILLLFVVAILLTVAPTAMANHCKACKLYPYPMDPPPPPQCIRYSNYGFQFCEEDYVLGECIVSDPCGNHLAAVTPLASEFAVASVERLDDPRTATSETLVASALTAPPAVR